ncbi:MAG: hypothetical protein ACFFDN_24905 [Candidatus Hodarchaeota archaeon]
MEKLAIIKPDADIIETIQNIEDCTFEMKTVADIQGTLELEEKIENKKNEVQRLDYVLVPNKALCKLGEEIAFDTTELERFDDILTFLQGYVGVQQRDYGGKFVDVIRRLITCDGWEVYTTKNNVKLLEVYTRVCSICETCNEIAPSYYDKRDLSRDPKNIYEQGLTLKTNYNNNIRKFRIHQPLLDILQKAKIFIVSLKHPCKHRSLQSIMELSDHTTQSSDPELSIVFPKDGTYD